jgi:hypothetical protein
MVKTDFAKYVVTPDRRPDILSKWAQKCFMHFADETAKARKKQPKDFNEIWFKNACSMALLFRWTDRMIAKSEWYQIGRGYKSQTVTYFLAWLSHLVRSKHGSRLNWEMIWKLQDVPVELRDFLECLAPQMAGTIKNTPENARNVGEYCKMQAYWETISKMDFNVPSLPDYLMVNTSEVQEEKKDCTENSENR